MKLRYSEHNNRILDGWLPPADAKIHIVSAAQIFKYKDTLLVIPSARHWDANTVDVITAFNSNNKNHLEEVEQGFIDQYGRFLTRVEAKKIAVENGQYKMTEQEYGELYSENLY